MARYAILRDNNICVVSSRSLASSVEVPPELDNVSDTDLIAHWRVCDGKFVSRFAQKKACEMKVAFVGNYGDTCGIATYQHFLYDVLVDRFADYRIFAERNPSLRIGNKIAIDKVIPCWKRGQPTQELATEISKFEPDIVLIQHEFGLWPNARYWLSLLTQLSNYRVIVVMHSVYPNHHDKLVFEGSMREVIVHLEMAKHNMLTDKTLSLAAHVIPHGCYPITNQTKLWDNYKSKYTFIQQGFGLRYKCFEQPIRAVSILKAKYPDVFFTALFSESPYSVVEHQKYYDELVKLITQLGVENNVGIVRGFQPDNVIDAYFRSNRAAVFPYASDSGHEVFGSSGAIRLAMAAGLPVISSKLPHFSDTPSIKVDTAEELAQQLDSLFASSKMIDEQVAKQNAWLDENSWTKVAVRYINVFERTCT